MLASAEFYDLDTKEWTLVSKDQGAGGHMTPPGKSPEGGQDRACHQSALWNSHSHR